MPCLRSPPILPRVELELRIGHCYCDTSSWNATGGGHAAIGCGLSLAAVLGAITYGVPDGNDHPNVGLLIAVISEGAFAICSGVLVSPTVFLTAGHCTDFLDELNAQTFVSFNSSAPFGPFVPGTPHTHPDFDLTFRIPGTSAAVRPGGRRAFRTATVYRVCIRSPGLEDGTPVSRRSRRVSRNWILVLRRWRRGPPKWMRVSRGSSASWISS